MQYRGGGICGEIVTVVENGYGETFSNPDENLCISHICITLGKCMNSIILPQAMDK